jgi:DNA-binding transcriptional regulator YdaS (Cro superfamily)
MEKELEQFRQEVERLRAGRQRGSLPYPETLRAFAVRYVAHALETGGTFAGAAKALGVSEPTLQAWRKGQPVAHRRANAPAEKPALVPVVVPGPKKRAAAVERAVPGGLVLVSPGGWRVEGLSAEAAAELLGRLRC